MQFLSPKCSLSLCFSLFCSNRFIHNYWSHSAPTPCSPTTLNRAARSFSFPIYAQSSHLCQLTADPSCPWEKFWCLLTSIPVDLTPKFTLLFCGTSDGGDWSSGNFIHRSHICISWVVCSEWSLYTRSWMETAVVQAARRRLVRMPRTPHSNRRSPRANSSFPPWATRWEPQNMPCASPPTPISVRSCCLNHEWQSPNY